MGRIPRSQLYLLKPNTAERVEKWQLEQKSDHDKRAWSRTFSIGDHVWVKNFGPGDRWLPGEIVGASGQLNFQVRLENGRQRKCHQDHLRVQVMEDGGSDMSSVAVDVDFPTPTY